MRGARLDRARVPNIFSLDPNRRIADSNRSLSGGATASEIADAVRSRALSAADVLERSLQRIAATNAEVNAFVHLDVDAARTLALQVDRLVAEGRDPGPLAGVPIGVKDTEDCAGMPTRDGSLFYQGQVPARTDSAMVARASSGLPVGPEMICRRGRDNVAFRLARVLEQTAPWPLVALRYRRSGG